MSCFFCNSDNHLSENCDIYYSNSERREIAQRKKCCKTCLSANHIHPYTKLCRFYEKCYNCFSRNHHTVFCPYPPKKPNIYVPDIDTVLLTRYLQLLDPVEQFSAVMSSPQILDFIDVKPFRIYQRAALCFKEGFWTEFLPTDNNSIINEIEIKKYETDPLKLLQHPFFQLLSLRKIYTVVSIINLQDCKVSSSEFNLLFSKYTKDLQCRNVEITPMVRFSDIFKKMPNVSRIKLYQTNIEFDSGWLENLVKEKNQIYLKQLKIDTDNFMFDGQISCENIFEKRT